MRTFCAAVAICLLPVLASAQDVLPSASLQMGLPSGSLGRRPLDDSRTRDLYRATPMTYAPGFHEPPPFDPRFFPCCGGFTGPVFAPGGWWPAPPQVVYVPYVIEREVPREVPRAAPPPSPAAPPPPPPTPGVPKTFYVIPGCYAGDKRPDPDALPRGCDIGRLRTIPPVIR